MVTAITIHCAATPNGRAFYARDVDAWHQQRGFKRNPAWIRRPGSSPYKHIGYQYVIGIDGTVEKGREEQETGAHVAGHNTGNIGICYVGGVDAKMQPKDTRTDAQKKALLNLIRTYKERYPGIIIRGHRDWPGVKKACPSFDVLTWLKQTGDA